MTWLLKYIRTITYIIALLSALAIYFYTITQTQIPLQHIALFIKYFANTSILFLYLTLLASPLYATFPTFPYRALYIKARKALGVSAFFFGLAHAVLAFFIGIGGFTGLSNITGAYRTSIILSIIALLILTILAITSCKYYIKKLGIYWKPLHRLVYIAGIFILIHATIMGSDILDLSHISFYAIGTLGVLEILRCTKYLLRKIKKRDMPPNAI